MDNMQISTFFFAVAPPAGAWIETLISLLIYENDSASRPPRARGLKLGVHGKLYVFGRVAPPAGAWIETRYD